MNIKTLYKHLVIVFNILLALPLLLFILLYHTIGIHENTLYEFIILIRINMVLFVSVILYYLIFEIK
jgi:hypothetical protein